MDAGVKKKWLEALRSGRYQQGQGRLSQSGKFCCLGVLADVMGVDGTVNGASAQWRGVTLYHFKGESSSTYLGEAFMVGLGLSDGECSRLANMNDYGASFGHIADYIEERL